MPHRSRRELHVLGRRAAIGGAMAMLVGCGKNVGTLQCTDTSGLAADDAKARNDSGYVDRTTEVGKTCETCQQYQAASGDSCGSCKLMKGPVHPYGYCKAYAKKG